MYLHEFVLNENIESFLAKFESDGDYEDYEIVAVSACGSYVLFILKEKAGS